MIISRISVPFPRTSRPVISSGCAATGSSSRLSRPILRRTSCYGRKSARRRRSPSVTEAVFSYAPRRLRARTDAYAARAHARIHAHTGTSENEDDEREAFIAYDPSPPAHMLKRLRLFARSRRASRALEIVLVGFPETPGGAGRNGDAASRILGTRAGRRKVSLALVLIQLRYSPARLSLAIVSTAGETLGSEADRNLEITYL